MDNPGSASVRSITAQEMRSLAIAAGVNVPIEQTWVWYEFEETLPGRNLIGFFAIDLGGRTVAIMTLAKFQEGTFDYLWAQNGPVWLVEQNADLERQVVDLIVDWAKKKSRLSKWIRLQLSYGGDGRDEWVRAAIADRSTLVSLEGGEEGVLSQFSESARTAVEKARAVSPVDVKDETDVAREDFTSYYSLLQGAEVPSQFASWSLGTYRSLIQRLSPDHVRLYAARYEGRLLSWLIFTISGTEAVCEWSARSDASADLDALAQTALFGAVELHKSGISLLELREEETADTHRYGSLALLRQEITGKSTQTTVAYDIPLNRFVYRGAGLLSKLSKRFGRR